ncbi:MAG: DUF3516 domain-containing protein, partial [Bifidobacteriaceae bacterium]|nr:DUF3516 domain-containing protein [Bifidobacteriaceae bacterium]
RYNIARSEGTLLRYISDVYRSLVKTVPEAMRNDELQDIIAWLGVLVRSVDSSLVDEWSAQGAQEGAENLAAPQTKNKIVEDERGLTILIRNALFYRIQLIDMERSDELGALDKDYNYNIHEWDAILDDFYDEHEYVNTDAKARSSEYFMLDKSQESSNHTWHVRQIIDDAEGEHNWAIVADVDLDATQNESSVVFSSYEIVQE